MSARADRGTDPRIARSRIVILQAAVDELADHGYGGVTIEGVAARAGVAKSTIYRHWADRLELIADAFETFHERMVPDTTGSPPRETIATLLTHVAEVVTDSTFSRCIPALIEGADAIRGCATSTTATQRCGAACSLSWSTAACARG